MVNFDRDLSLALDETVKLLDCCETDSPIRRMLEYRFTNISNRIENTKPQRFNAPRPDAKTWQVLRASVLNRDAHVCQGCGATERLDVHHVIPLYRGGTNDPSNLISLCRECHAKIHTWLEVGDDTRN
jgi:5-methylcytosine-specific restriction endonuclease McrA